MAAWSSDIEERLFRDSRFDYLAQVSGETKFSAVGRMIYLWRDCIQSMKDTRSKSEIEIATGWFNPGRQSFADLMVESLLAEKTTDGLYRIKGVREKMQFMVELKESQSAGGRVSAQRERDEKGRLLPKSGPSGVQVYLDESPSGVQVGSKSLQVNPSPSPSPSPKKKKEEYTEASLPLLARIWNQNRGSLAEVKACGKDREKKSSIRWKENPSEEYWVEVIKKIAASPFCQGNSSSGWRAGFDFLLQPETQHKVIEGKYDRPGSAPQKLKTLEDLERELANG